MHLELIAIAEALSYVDSINYDKFVILSDSKSALQHIARCTSHVRGTPIAYIILDNILKLQTKCKIIVLQWIPSHIQLKENDDVDALAKQAIVDGVPMLVQPLHSDYVRFLKIQCKELWLEYFDKRSTEKGIWYRTIQPQIPACPWIDESVFKRSVLVTALRLRSGHISSNKFAFLMKKVPSPNCNVCECIEDVQHILMECVRNADDRRIMFGSMFDVGRCNSILASPMSDEAKKMYFLANKCLDRKES